MNELNFVLKINLILPASGDLRRGYFLFPATEFGLTYSIAANPRTQEISISLQVVHMESGDIVWTVGTYKITEQGFPVEVDGVVTYINKYSEVIAYFKGDGSLTPEGIIWAKTTTFNGATIGDYV